MMLRTFRAHRVRLLVTVIFLINVTMLLVNLNYVSRDVRTSTNTGPISPTWSVRSVDLLDRENLIRDRNVTQTARLVRPLVTESHRDDFVKISPIITSCELTEEELISYPHCLYKIQYLKDNWKFHTCYEDLGVDGTTCSIVQYLAKVEKVCPNVQRPGFLKDDPSDTAHINSDMAGIMGVLRDPNRRHAYHWMRLRIERLWARWLDAAGSFTTAYHGINRTKRRVLVYLGFLSRDSGLSFVENSFKGGALGEYVIWSDLVASLYILGHDVTVASEVEQLKIIAESFSIQAETSPCWVNSSLTNTPLIYTDIIGVIQMKSYLNVSYDTYRCLLHVVDCFGTEPAYNHNAFVQSIGKGSIWSGLNLIPQQFYTMFPHTQDNSFVGFIVDIPTIDLKQTAATKRDIAVVYGKAWWQWEGHEEFLRTVSQSGLEIHGTVAAPDDVIPNFVINHGVLHGEALHNLLHQAKVFIGLGNPEEGPAPLEAIAHGAVFINPRFSEAFMKDHNPLSSKPTDRMLTSQNPYVEDFIGEPHVYTVDINNHTEVMATIKRILRKNKFQPYIPYEFTMEGHLRRMNAYIEHQNFCQYHQQNWPPAHAVHTVLGEPGHACNDVCRKHGRLCEPSYFHRLNTVKSFSEAGIQCANTTLEQNIFFPAVRHESCVLQSDELLFSCAGGMAGVRRLCPCRTFNKQQSALCEDCEV